MCSLLFGKFLEDSIGFSTVLLVLLIGLVVYTKKYFDGWEDQFWQGVYVEFTGAIFDIAIFGVLIALFLRIVERRREVRHQQEIIEDFKKWDSREAQLRIAGAIRRLNRRGVYKIDFRGAMLSNFEFRDHNISSIRGSIFYDGSWGYPSNRTVSQLTFVSFDHVDCRDVVFSAYNPFQGMGMYFELPMKMNNCSFRNAELQSSKFCGCTLHWDQSPPEDIGEWIEEEGGDPSFVQTHFSPFFGANLKHSSFVGTSLKNADFRGAMNLDSANFSGANGVETCVFDTEEIRGLSP